MSLNALIASDGAALVDAVTGFGELVIYRPAGGSPREIYATVRRSSPQPVPGAPVPAPASTIWIRNHATLGATSIDKGADRFDVAENEGGTAVSHPVAKAVGANGGWLITLR